MSVKGGGEDGGVAAVDTKVHALIELIHNLILNIVYFLSSLFYPTFQLISATALSIALMDAYFYFISNVLALHSTPY